MNHTEHYAQAVTRLETLIPRLKSAAAPPDSELGLRAVVELACAARSIVKACTWLEQAEGQALNGSGDYWVDPAKEYERKQGLTISRG